MEYNDIEQQFINLAIAESIKHTNINLRKQQEIDFQECLCIDKMKEEQKRIKEKERELKLKQFQNEPIGDNIVSILFRYNGRSITRNFYIHDTIKTLYDFVSITDICPNKEWNLIYSIPRKIIKSSNHTLEELKISKRELIIIETIE